MRPMASITAPTKQRHVENSIKCEPAGRGAGCLEARLPNANGTEQMGCLDPSEVNNRTDLQVNISFTGQMLQL